MDERELLKERFKSAVSSAVKAISENFDLEIKFDNSTTSKKNSLNLPEVVNLKNLQDFTNVRAFADSEALKIKYNNSEIYKRNEPKGSMSKALYLIAEKIRYEKIGSDKLIGVNSGYKTSDINYRSRGLWVHKPYRRRKVSSLLLYNTIKKKLVSYTPSIVTLSSQ